MAPMDRRRFIASAGAGLAAPLILTKTEKLTPVDPQVRKIVLFLVDDLRWDFLSFLGHPLAQTPNIDKLAAGGMLFENSFVVTSLENAGRASIVSGLYTHKHKVFDNQSTLPDDLETLPRRLRKAGYKTGVVGSWGLRNSDEKLKEEFDYRVTLRGAGEYYNPILIENGKPERKMGYVTDLITESAEEFLKKNCKDDFFLLVSHKGVQAMFDPSPRHRGKFAEARVPKPDSMADTDANYEDKPDWVRRARKSTFGVDGMYAGELEFDTFYRNYCECLMAVDESLSRLCRTLDEKGVLDETLIIFTGSSGFLHGEHGLIENRTMYEPSIRVPLIAHCPALIKPNSRRREMVLNIDLCPTILQMMGLEPIPDTHGESLVSLLGGNAVPNWRSMFLYEYFWERSFPQFPTVIGLRNSKYSYMRYRGIWDKCELYDITVDSDQRENLLGEVKITDQYQMKFGEDAPHFDIYNSLIEGIRLRSTVWELDKRMYNLLHETDGLM